MVTIVLSKPRVWSSSCRNHVLCLINLNKSLTTACFAIDVSLPPDVTVTDLKGQCQEITPGHLMQACRSQDFTQVSQTKHMVTVVLSKSKIWSSKRRIHVLCWTNLCKSLTTAHVAIDVSMLPPNKCVDVTSRRDHHWFEGSRELTSRHLFQACRIRISHKISQTQHMVTAILINDQTLGFERSAAWG